MTLRFSLCVLILIVLATPPLSRAEGTIYKMAKIDREEYLPGMKKPDTSRELKISERFTYYDIDGANSAELRRQMRQSGTKWNDGKVYASLTSWDINYHYDVISENGRYAVKSVNTDIAIDFIYPRRVGAASTATATLSAQWKKYMDCLVEHENGHKDLAVKTAWEINEALVSMESFKSRKELDSEVKRQVQAKFKKLNEIQVEYDDHTKHGEKQGAVLM